MKKKIVVLFFSVMIHLGLVTNLNALNVTIIESQSFLSTDVMDIKWQNIVNSMGYTSSILPQTTLDNTTFFTNTDILIISSGSIFLPANRVNTILQFLQTGKSVYLQGEYQCSLSTNQAFATLVNTLGGTFSWGGITNGILQMNILGSFTNTQLPIFNTVLSNFNYGCQGTGCGVQYFLERNGKFYGYFFCPPNPLNGRLIQITDQDWININGNDTLMKNIITHLVDPSLCSATNFTPTNLGQDTTLCNGTNYVLNATNSNATYLWQDGSSNPTFTVTTPGTYWVQVTNNCGIFSDTVTVNYSLAPSIFLGNDTTLCAGQQLTLNATTTGATYTWQDGSSNSTFTVTSAGLYAVLVNLSGCVVSDNINISYTPPISANLGNDTTLCEGQTLLLDATISNASYHWQDGSTASSYYVDKAGTYIVDILSLCGTTSDTIQINYIPGPSLNIGDDTVLCGLGSFTINAFTNNASYSWNDNSNLSSLTVASSGTYWVEIKVGSCSKRDTIQIDFQDKPNVYLGEDALLCKGETLILDASVDNAIYRWQDNSIGATYKVTQKGNYWVVVNVNNCISSDSIFIDYYPESCNCTMIVPNAFSPNGDGKNEEFSYIVNKNIIELQEFIVYDRWGGIAFKAQNLNDSWNGRTKGVDANLGTYYYLIKYKCLFSNQQYVLKGDVLLIR